MSENSDRTALYRNDPRPTEEVLGLALANDPDHDDEGYWKPVTVLQHRLPEILQLIEELSVSSDEKSRDTAATILGQNMVETKLATDLCAEVLLEMLAQEKSPSVLVSIIHALGHLHDPQAVAPLVALRSHPDANVRYAIASSLGGCEEEQAIAALIELSADTDYDVRNWATFGLGSLIETDTPAIREALFARLEEKEDEARGEAFVGLARRGDFRVIPALLRELDSLPPDVLSKWMLVTDAADAVIAHASASGAKEWQPLLEKFAARGIKSRTEPAKDMHQPE